MTDIRHATLQDLPGTYRVCLLTGDAGGDATAQYRNPDLLGHVYVGPYVVGEPGHALVAADEDGVAGYCLAARDTLAFAAWAESEWWPALRAQFARRDDGTPDAAIIELLHEPPVAPRSVVDAYPAHLHIDLLERVRGTGTGRRLIERQMQTACRRGRDRLPPGRRRHQRERDRVLRPPRMAGARARRRGLGDGHHSGLTSGHGRDTTSSTSVAWAGPLRM